VILRPYQERAVDLVGEAWRGGARSVCLVAPTGSGKTVMGCEVLRRTLARRPERRVLWLAHRHELIAQARDRVDAYLGDVADHVEVATVQGLAASERRPAADLLVLDEAHHYAPGAAEWHEVAGAYSGAWRLGLTATPERGDGSPLGDTFSALVVGAQYSDLLADGSLVPCRVMRPDDQLDGLAQDPVAAWLAQAGERRGFLFGGRVEECEGYTRRLREAGVPAALISGATPAAERAASLEAFRGREIRCLASVYVLTEGVDVPEASVCLLARGCQHASTYLQMVGRVLRPAPGKADALLIDLPGASHAHGWPTADREYSLSGEAIREAGKTDGRAPRAEIGEDRPVRIYSRALSEVYAGAETPREARLAEWRRLERLCRAKGWGIGWAAGEYRKLFGAAPSVAWIDSSDLQAQRAEWRRRARERGYKQAWVWVQERRCFG
jgi:superfamily II DNA or RNA helicase